MLLRQALTTVWGTFRISLARKKEVLKKVRIFRYPTDCPEKEKKKKVTRWVQLDFYDRALVKKKNLRIFHQFPSPVWLQAGYWGRNRRAPNDPDQTNGVESWVGCYSLPPPTRKFVGGKNAGNRTKTGQRGRTRQPFLSPFPIIACVTAWEWDAISSVTAYIYR